MSDSTPTEGAPCVAIVATTLWPLAARLAMEFLDQGWSVDAICPRNNPLVCLGRIRRRYGYWPLGSGASLARALRDSRPDLIVPADDRAVADLCRLDAASIPALANVTSRTRWQVGEAARAEGIATPTSIRIDDPAGVMGLAPTSFPWVIKAGGSWGGEGVRIVATHDAALAALTELTTRRNRDETLRRTFIERDRFEIRSLFPRRHRREVTAQAYITGVPANCVAACVDGRVVDLIAVEVLRSEGKIGPATLVRVIDNDAMRQAATCLARRFGLTGLFGFDFMIERGSGTAYLIEMNDRPTRICCLPSHGRGSLIASLSRHLRGAGVASESPGLSAGDLVAFFPQIWQADPHDPLLLTAYHDVPWTEPALLRRCLAPTRWPARVHRFSEV